MQRLEKYTQTRTLLTATVIIVAVMRGIMFLLWDAPVRSLLWDQDLMEGFIQFLGMGWEEYALSAGETASEVLTISMSLGLLLGSFLLIFNHQKVDKYKMTGLVLIHVVLLFWALLKYKSKFFIHAQFFEHSAQFLSPVVLLAFYRFNHHPLLRVFIKAVIAFTFVGHGLFAFGFYPTPGNFIDMTISITGLSETNALIFLKIAGILDFIAAFFLFIPKVDKYAAIYCVFWGFSTALARPLSYFQDVSLYETAFLWIPEFIVRAPHYLLPLLIVVWYRNKSTEKHPV